MRPLPIEAHQYFGIGELFSWCSEYHNWCLQDLVSGRREIHPLQRFAIGFYQVHQGIKWEGTNSEEESFMAAAIHFGCTAEALGLNTHYSVFAKNHTLESIPHRYADIQMTNDREWKGFLEKLSEAQQHIFYEWMGAGTNRSRSRYSPDRLGGLLGEIIFFLISLVSPNCRARALREATEIMTGSL